MKNLIHTAVVTLFAASAAHAQQAVQWKVSDGGNGHWYGKLEGSYQFSYHALNTAARDRGGHLLSLVSRAEEEFVLAVWGTTFLGLQCPPGSGSFNWSSGEPVTYSNWGTSACFSGPYPNNGSGAERFVYQSHPECAGSQGFAPAWDDYYQSDLGTYIVDPVLEFDADCNSDGIVDYGQCRNGALPDYNGDNIPDCCERGEACVLGNYPVQWRTENGGNGHWYKLLHVLPSQSAEQHFVRAQEAGGHTATISSAEEDRVCFNTASSAPIAVLIGVRKQAGSNTPEWITGDPWAYSNWHAGEGGNSSERYADYVPEWGGQWQDTDTTPQQYSLVEWDADCNNDNIVDYGQILQGQLADANTNGIPDICEGPICRDADLFRDFNVNGADLGILLSQWGPNTALTVSDINKDGFVNGADLGIMLSFWGACPN